MSFLLKDIARTSLVDAVYNEILSRRSNFHYFIGKIIEWADPDSPETPLNTGSYEYETRNDILAVKKVQSTDISYVVPRIDWTANTVYDQYDPNYSSTFLSDSGASSLKTSNFYILTSEFKVYKCLFNNNGANSTVQPTFTDLIPASTADGYLWKYLYSIPLSLRNRFLTEDLMPVQTSIDNTYYSNGEISLVVVEQQGSGYLGNAQTFLTVNGTFRGSAGNVVANLDPILNSSGSIVGVKIKNPGNNYHSANITVTDVSETGSSYYKSLRTATVFNGGNSYSNSAITSNTKAIVSTSGIFQPNSNAELSLNFLDNIVTSINIIAPGNGYTNDVIANTTVSITTSGNIQPIANATANLMFSNTAILTPLIYNGQIDRVVINDPGIDYSSNLQTTIVVSGDGTGASLVPYISSAGALEDVIIGSRGNGYTYVDLEIVGDGTGANARAEIFTSELDTDQAVVELSAIDGAIHALRIVNAGTNYFNGNTTVSVTGDGSNFTGNVVLANNNSISHISVTNPGYGYTYANVVISGVGSNAVVQAIFPPPGGHGSDAVKELFADTLMFYSTINNDKLHNINILNDFRQFGLIKNIKQFSNSRAFANVVGTSCYLITANTVLNSQSNTLARDTILHLNGDINRAFEVVEVVSSNNQILLNNLNNFLLTDGNSFYDANTASNFDIVSIDKYPDINKFSGELIFIDNRTQVTYSDEQLVTFRTTIKL